MNDFFDRDPGAYDNYRHFEEKIEGFNDEGLGRFCAEIRRILTIKKFNSTFKWFNRNWITQKKGSSGPA